MGTGSARRLEDGNRPTAVDLFSGCGGLTLGLKQAGFKVVGAVDNDPLSVETYRANHGGVRVWEADIRTLPAARVLRELGLCPGELDLLAGCPPCQGFSSTRTLNGSRRIRDARNSLLEDFLRFVRVMRPRTVMLENVPGLARHYRFRAFLKDLRHRGYKITHSVLDAADYGVPQRRRRLVVLASRRRKPGLAVPARRRRTVRDAIAWLPPAGVADDPLHVSNERRGERIMSLIRRVPRDGGSRMELGSAAQLACHQKCNGFKDIYGRIAWDAVAPTITSGCVNPSKGRFLHPEADRAITLREAALLQTFPPNYCFALDRGKFATAALIGNALPPELVRRLAKSIREHL